MKRRKPKQIKALLGVGSAIINDNFENPASATKIKKEMQPIWIASLFL